MWWLSTEPVCVSDAIEVEEKGQKAKMRTRWCVVLATHTHVATINI